MASPQRVNLKLSGYLLHFEIPDLKMNSDHKLDIDEMAKICVFSKIAYYIHLRVINYEVGEFTSINQQDFAAYGTKISFFSSPHFDMWLYKHTKNSII